MNEQKKHYLKAFRRKEGENNIAFFAAYYFPHYATKPNSDLHRFLYTTTQEIVEDPEGQRLAVAAPRGNAKSSIVSLIFILWCAVYKKKQFIVLISDTSTQANSFLSNVREELENNIDLLNDFGNLTGAVWQNENLILANGVKITALGARKKIRGLRHKQYRPDLIVCDDLENDENTINPEQRAKNEKWFFKAVSKAGGDNTDIIVIGTIIHYDSLLSKLLINPLYQSKKYQAVIQDSQSPKWQEWEDLYLTMNEEEKKERPNKAEKFFEDHKEEMLEGVKVLWPEGQPYYRLREIKLTEGQASFDSEYQNNPLNPDECLFNEDWFVFIEPNWEDYTEIIGAVDPSMGKTQHSDYSAIIAIGRHKEGFLDVLEADVARRNPDDIINETIQTFTTINNRCSQATLTNVAVESVQFQEYFKDRLALESRKRGVYLPISSTENQTTRKEIRIQALQPLIKNGTIRFQRRFRLLLEQLKYYPLADHDDAPDALEMAVRKAQVPQLTSQKY